MPELPEVETVVRDLKKRVCGRKIVDYWTDTPKLVKKPELKRFIKEIKGQKIVDVQRRGKNILFFLKKGFGKDFNLMLVHQKMTGHFLLGKWKIEKINKKETAIPLIKGPIFSDKYNSYIRAIFYLDNGWQLGLSDLRKFAKIVFGSFDEIKNLDLDKLGPDALSKEFNAKYLYNIFQKRKKPVKSLLLDQTIVSGVGNIYGDEALFVAKINPLKNSKLLTEKEVKSIVLAIKKVLKKSLKLRGISISDYRDTYGNKGGYDKVRLVYDREGDSCYSCGAKIKRVKIGGRSSYYCPNCQKL
jgi:formamidopyrimidine-DNA glycosylase